MLNVSVPFVASDQNSKMLHYGQHGPFGSYGGMPGPAPAPREKPNGFLDMSVHPPVFEVAPPSSGNTKGSRGFGRVGRVISSVQKVCSSIGLMNRTSTTWVNRDILTPPPVPNYCPPDPMEGVKIPYLCSPVPVESYVDPPWFQLQSEGYVGMGDPWWHPMSYGMQYLPEEKCPVNGIWMMPAGRPTKSQPLNPEAKEWVPKEHNFKNGIVPAQVYNDGLGGFCEITENEISLVRGLSQGDSKTPKNIADINCQDVDKGDQCITTDIVNDTGKPSSASELIEAQSQDNVVCDDESVKLEMPSSYAGVVREKVTVLNRENDQQEAKQKDLTEILPRFQTSEKKCSPAKESQEASDSPKPAMPFRTGSKVQKKLSKRFIEDLKSSPSSTTSGSYIDVMGSPCGSFSGDSLSGSPLCSGTPTAVLPWRMRKDSSGSLNSVGGSSTSSVRMGENSPGNERARTLSESSLGSVDSLDIEFDEDEVPETKDPSPKEAIVPCKLVEGISCVLSLLHESSDTEDDDFEDDEDWDEIDSSNCDIDLTSWETFGLSTGLILPVTIPKTVQEEEELGEECENPKEVSLKEINARWASEIEKDVQCLSSPKVRFVENPQVYHMVAWGFAYRASRKGIWEQYARDRERFRKRVCELESVLAPVIEITHRQKIYENLCAQAS